MRQSLLFPSLLLAVALLGTACTSDGPADETAAGEEPVAAVDTVTIDSKADSVATRLVEAHGGRAWASAPMLRFDFAVERGGQSGPPRRHLWNRETGEYRLEWTGGEDSTYVALLDVSAASGNLAPGTVYLNGSELTGAQDSTRRAQAYRAFINDTYWLLAPLKVFDPGVNRSYVADSSTADHDVLHLSFGEVGLTPGDEYWMYVDAETGRLDRWAFHLQSMPDEAPPARFTWTGADTLQAPGGSVVLATEKPSSGGPVTIYTRNLSLPASAPDDAFTRPDPMLDAASGR
jgi:hypothetical protein